MDLARENHLWEAKRPAERLAPEEQGKILPKHHSTRAATSCQGERRRWRWSFRGAADSSQPTTDSQRGGLVQRLATLDDPGRRCGASLTTFRPRHWHSGESGSRAAALHIGLPDRTGDGCWVIRRRRLGVGGGCACSTRGRCRWRVAG